MEHGHAPNLQQWKGTMHHICMFQLHGLYTTNYAGISAEYFSGTSYCPGLTRLRQGATACTSCLPKASCCTPCLVSVSGS